MRLGIIDIFRGAWKTGQVSDRTAGAVKSINFYQGTIACAPSFTGDKDVTITALAAANKGVVIPARGGFSSGTGFYPMNIAITDGNILWDYVEIPSTTVVRFKNVVNSDAGLTKNIKYAFWVLEFY